MTLPLLHGSDVAGMPVVDVTSGDDLAGIGDVVFDAEAGTIRGFTLVKRSLFHGSMGAVLPVDRVLSVGTHAVMVSGPDALTDPSDAPAAVADADPGNDVVDDIVVTESGRQLGTVTDVVILGGSQPRVIGFQVGGGAVGDGLIPLHAHAGVSGSALVVPDSFEARVRTDLTGLAAELADLDRGPS
jgi:uncharacterized protein YrrD